MEPASGTHNYRLKRSLSIIALSPGIPLEWPSSAITVSHFLIAFMRGCENINSYHGFSKQSTKPYQELFSKNRLSQARSESQKQKQIVCKGCVPRIWREPPDLRGRLKMIITYRFRGLVMKEVGILLKWTSVLSFRNFADWLCSYRSKSCGR